MASCCLTVRLFKQRLGEGYPDRKQIEEARRGRLRKMWKEVAD